MWAESMSMNDQQFVAAVREEVLDSNCEIYRQLFGETQPRSATDPHWQDALRFYGRLDDASQQTLHKIIRQVMVDTISNMFAVLDGVARLGQQSAELVVELAGQRLNGSLQDLFLEMEGRQARG